MSELDLAQARFNMIEQQIRPWDVLDLRVLDLMGQFEREAFVPAELRNLAYADTAIPIGHGQHMLPPRVEARMLQALDVQPGERALEVGTGTGYVAALLGRLADSARTIEIVPELADAARGRLTAAGAKNVEVVTGDALEPMSASFDAIAVTGSLPDYQGEFRTNLAIGGRLFVIVGTQPVMEARLYTRVDANAWSMQSLFETVVDPLVNARQPNAFVF